MFQGAENPYYYIGGPGQTNSMIPLTGPGGFNSQEPPKLPPRPCDDDQVDTLIVPVEHDTVSMHSYLQIIPDTDNPTEEANQDGDKIIEKGDQVYEQIPAGTNIDKCGGEYETPKVLVTGSDGNAEYCGITPENQYASGELAVQASNPTFGEV